MIKRAAEMELEIREKMRGGKGHVEILHVLKQAEMGGKCRLLAKITLNPGCSIGRHTHDNEEEVFYILEGTGIVDDNGTVTPVGTGDAVLTGGGNFHAIENTGSSPLVMMAVILLY